MTDQFTAGFHRRGDAGYEAARSGAVWNGNLPARYPDVIVQACTEQDVIAAVRLARREGLQIGIRSGGHSWAASFLRDGGMLLDLSRLDAIEIDAGDAIARVQPGAKGTNINRALRPRALFFPSGHCVSVGIGGFLLQGGFGWNSRLWGPACASVLAIDVVTAAGELVRADETQNADLFWAARGSGTGFFGVVTRFHLKLRPRPRCFMNSLFQYPIDMLDDVLAWAHDMMFQADRHMEPMVFVRRGMLGEAAATATVIGPTLAYSREQAREIVSILEAFPQRHRAIRQDIAEETEFEGLMAPTEEFYPQGSRYHVDNMWTEANVADLLPGMRDIAATLPDSPSHMMWMLWGQPQTLPDMAFSMQAPLYVGLYAVGQDPTSDSRGRDWSTGHMRRLEPFASGIQLADENLGRRPFRFMAPPNLQRLQAIRAVRDPDGLFHSWMAMPA